MTFRMPVYTQVPEIVGGYSINGRWEVIVPVARVNEIPNPSFETALTGYTAGAGVLQRLALKQYHGVYSATYTPSAALTDGFFYGTVAMTAGQFRAVSCKFFGQANVQYALSVATTGGVDLVKYSFKATGRWQWIWLYWMEVSTTTRRIYFKKDGSNDTHAFYVDGVQSEVINTGETVSTYIDGDQIGYLPNQQPYPYGWNGTPHASTSYRLLSTRAGGSVIPFSKYGFLLMAVVGLGLPAPQNVNTEYARIDGGYPNFTRKPISQFSIAGNMSESSAPQLRASRSNLSRLFDKDAATEDQELALRYQHTDNCDNIQSDTVVLPCKYVSGWDGQADNHHAQNVTMTFEQYLPAIAADGEVGAALTVQQAITYTALLSRNTAGVWSNLGVTAGLVLKNLLLSRDGKLYVIGQFAAIGGVAAANIAYYDFSDSAWHAMGTGLLAGSTGYTLAEDAAGIIYAGGDFASAGGVANTAKIAKWNPVTLAWSSITPAGAANSTVLRIRVTPDNFLVVGGLFTTINAVAANFVHKYNIATGAWTASYGAGPGGGIVAMTLSFRGSNPIVSDSLFIKQWSGAAWVSIGLVTGPETVIDLYMGLNGILYAGGQLTSISGVAGNSIMSYNGVTWIPMGTGLTNTTGGAGTNDVEQITQLSNGNVLAVGNFDTTAGAVVLSGFATFDGATWSCRDVLPTFVGSTSTNVAARGDGLTVILGSGSPTVVAGQTTVVNPGTAVTYPTIVLKGPTTGTSLVKLFQNITTGRNVQLNLTIAAGEIDTFVFQPDNLQFTSNVNGNLQSAILPGSNEADFFLARGTNVIGVLADNANVTGTIRFVKNLTSLDDLQ